MFKERLRITLKAIGEILLKLLFFVLLTGLLLGFIVLVTMFKTGELIVGWLFLGGFGLVILFLVIGFVDWLFIEPFKKRT